MSSYDFHSFRVKGIYFYHCDELQEFVYSCIERFENLPMKQLAETLNEFVKRYVCCDCIVYMYYMVRFLWPQYRTIAANTV